MVVADQRVHALTDHVLLGVGVCTGERLVGEVARVGARLLGLLHHVLARHHSLLHHGHVLVAGLVVELNLAAHLALLHLRRHLLVSGIHGAGAAHDTGGAHATAHGATHWSLLGHTSAGAAALHAHTGATHALLHRREAAGLLGTTHSVLELSVSSALGTAGHLRSAGHEGGHGTGESEARAGASGEATHASIHGTATATHGAAREVAGEHHVASGLALLRLAGETGLAHVHAHERRHHATLAHALGKAHVLGSIGGSQVSTAVLLALVQGDHKRLALEVLAVELSHGAGGLLGRAVAHEAEALGGLLVDGVAHDAGRGDGAEGGEGLAEGLVADGVSDVLHVQVHALVLGHALLVQGVQAGLDLAGALGLLLGTADVQLEGLLALLEALVGQLFESLGSRLVLSEVHEAEALGGAVGVHVDGAVSDGTEGLEDAAQLGLVPGGGELLGVQVGPVGLASALSAAHEEAHTDLHIVDQGSVELLDGILSSLGSLEVHVAVALGVAVLVSSDLAGKDVAEHGEGVGKTLVVHTGSQVSHEHVTNSGLAETGVTLGPHDTAGAALNISEVHGVQSALGVLYIVEVYIGITKGSSGDGITAHSDGGHRTDTVEQLKKKTL